MLFRSTGLGKTELTGRIDSLKRQGDYLIMLVDVTDPVKWRIRGALTCRDLLKVLGKCVTSFSILAFILSPKQWFNKNAKHPGEF
jgi:hypothetical protein